MKFVTFIIAKRGGHFDCVKLDYLNVADGGWPWQRMGPGVFFVSAISILPVFYQLSYVEFMNFYVNFFDKTSSSSLEAFFQGKLRSRLAKASTQQLRPIKQPQNEAVVILSKENVMQ